MPHQNPQTRAVLASVGTSAAVHEAVLDLGKLSLPTRRLESANQLPSSARSHLPGIRDGVTQHSAVLRAFDDDPKFALRNVRKNPTAFPEWADPHCRFEAALLYAARRPVAMLSRDLAEFRLERPSDRLAVFCTCQMATGRALLKYLPTLLLPPQEFRRAIDSAIAVNPIDTARHFNSKSVPDEGMRAALYVKCLIAGGYAAACHFDRFAITDQALAKRTIALIETHDPSLVVRVPQCVSLLSSDRRMTVLCNALEKNDRLIEPILKEISTTEDERCRLLALSITKHPRFVLEELSRNRPTSEHEVRVLREGISSDHPGVQLASLGYLDAHDLGEHPPYREVVCEGPIDVMYESFPNLYARANFSSAERSAALHRLAERHTRRAVAFLPQAQLENADDAVEILALHASRCDLWDLTLVLTVLGACALDEERRIAVLGVVAGRNLPLVNQWAKEQGMTFSSDQLMTLCGYSLRYGSIAGAVELAKVIVKNSGEVVTVRRTSQLLCELLSNLGHVKGLTPSEATCLEVAGIATASGFIPSQALLDTLRWFRVEDRPFLKEMLSSCGEGLGGQILLSAKQFASTRGSLLSDQEKEWLRALGHAGYRGVTVEVLERYFTLSEMSVVEAKEYISQLKLFSSKLLRGEELSESAYRDRGVASAICAAYRLPRRTPKEVAETIKTVRGYQEHCARLSLRPEGYDLSIGAAQNLRLKDAVRFDSGVTFGALSRMGLVGEGARKGAPLGQVSALIPQLLSGSDVGEKKSLLLAYAHSAGIDARIEGWWRAFDRLLMGAQSAQSFYEQAMLGRDVLEIMNLDIVPTIAQQLALKMAVASRQESLVRKALRLRDDEPLTPDSFPRALEIALRAQVQREVKILGGQLKCFELESGGALTPLRGYVSKARHAYFSREAVGLCSGSDLATWNDPDFLQMIVVAPERGRIVGNIQLHLFGGGEEGAPPPAVLARINPSEEFCSQHVPADVVEVFLRAAREFAEDNRRALYVPGGQSRNMLLTNRAALVTPIGRWCGRDIPAQVRCYGTVSTSSVAPVLKAVKQ